MLLEHYKWALLEHYLNTPKTPLEYFWNITLTFEHFTNTSRPQIKPFSITTRTPYRLLLEGFSKPTRTEIKKNTNYTFLKLYSKKYLKTWRLELPNLQLLVILGQVVSPWAACSPHTNLFHQSRGKLLPAGGMHFSRFQALNSTHLLSKY